MKQTKQLFSVFLAVTLIHVAIPRVAVASKGAAVWQITSVETLDDPYFDQQLVDFGELADNQEDLTEAIEGIFSYMEEATWSLPEEKVLEKTAEHLSRIAEFCRLSRHSEASVRACYDLLFNSSEKVRGMIHGALLSSEMDSMPAEHVRAGVDLGEGLTFVVWGLGMLFTARMVVLGHTRSAEKLLARKKNFYKSSDKFIAHLEERELLPVINKSSEVKDLVFMARGRVNPATYETMNWTTASENLILSANELKLMGPGDLRILRQILTQLGTTEQASVYLQEMIKEASFLARAGKLHVLRDGLITGLVVGTVAEGLMGEDVNHIAIEEALAQATPLTLEGIEKHVAAYGKSVGFLPTFDVQIDDLN